MRVWKGSTSWGRVPRRQRSPAVYSTTRSGQTGTAETSRDGGMRRTSTWLLVGHQATGTVSMGSAMVWRARVSQGHPNRR